MQVSSVALLFCTPAGWLPSVTAGVCACPVTSYSQILTPSGMVFGGGLSEELRS